MTKIAPQDRLLQLIDKATEVFIASGGYRRTRMADIAQAMGVASGTIFQYVETKEALFDLLVRHADRPETQTISLTFPVPTPAAGSTLNYVRARVAEESRVPALDHALASPAASTPGELAEIVGEIYDTLHRNRRGIKLVEQSALDYPDLAAIWFIGARVNVLNRLERYLRQRIDAGCIEAPLDVAIAARMIVETCVLWAVHRHWDPQPIPYSESQVRAMVIAMCLGQMLRFPSPKGRRP